LNLSPREKSKLKRTLKEMVKEGILKATRNRFYLPENRGLLTGKYVSNPNGYGFVVPENKLLDDIFIPPTKTKDALNGDLVEVIYTRKRKGGKNEGKIIKVIKRKNEKIYGYFERKLNRNFLIPIDFKNSKEIILDKISPFNPMPGMIVEVELTEGLRGKVTDVLGYPDEAGVDLKVITSQYSLSENFPQEVIQEANKIPLKLKREDIRGREDFRNKIVITIDGEDARDFDDAVSLEKLSNGNYLLGVHIADVSHFVKQGSNLDKEAYRRGNSVYFPDKVLPMLPERLSNQVCSLKPGKDRLTFSVLMEINEQGEILNYRFTPSIIRSYARMTYNSVFKILQNDKEEQKKYKNLVSLLFLMRELAQILREKRIEEGSLDFDLVEPELIYRNGTLHAIGRFEQNEAHQIIEEFMLAANETVASFLAGNDYPLLFRVHESPEKLKLDKLKKLLQNLGLLQNGKKPLTSFDLQKIIYKVQGKPEEKFVSLKILKSLPLAHYSVQNAGHFGLAKEFYTHFTSPIRRYPDLVVHRILKKALKGEKINNLPLDKIAEHCSETERNAEDAERDLIEWRIIRFLRSKLGEVFTGTIMDIAKEGLIIELDEYFIEGMIHYSDLRDDYYYKISPYAIKGKRKGKIYKLGDRLKVTLAMVDIYRRKVFFVPSR
ncbi:ribonuclease R, partial [Candidatus Aminicenantes bacterium AC-708-M15]|nr:ribonuclease R [Candidatus Aminicenantes bacterium AC-708-M15]